MSSKLIYYLTGMGGTLNTGLGQAILDRGFDVTGRQLSGEFRNISFQDQIDTVCNDLKENFWHAESRIVCNSFGAYIFLHALAQVAMPYAGKTLLLSPIIGEFANVDELRPMNFIPPRASALLELANAGTYPKLMSCEIHTGSEDWQSNPSNVIEFGSKVGIPVHIVAKGGHMLPKEYVGDVLDKWLM